MELKDKLVGFYRTWTTRKLAKAFSEYAKSLGLRKWDGRRNDNSNTFFTEGKDEGWDRVICSIVDPEKKEQHIQIVLRKYSYLLIQVGEKRIFEYDSKKDLIECDDEMLKEAMKNHKALFDVLLK